MVTGKLIGSNDTTIDGSCTLDYIGMWKFTAVATGICSEIRVKCSGGGNVKLAIYADSSGSPGSRLAVQNTSTAVVVGWNTISLASSCTLISGTPYWLAMNSSANIVGYDDVGSGACMKYKSCPFTNDLPDPAGTGYADNSLYQGVIAGWGVLVLSPSSISQPVSYGSPKLIVTVKPSSLVQLIAYGIPTVLTSSLTIQPLSVVQVIAIGTPALRYPQTIVSSSIVQPIAVGTPWVGILGFIRPQSAIQQISVGSPTILKYVWHVILDGQYATETPGVNRAYIIGRDRYGNPVYGTAVNADEVALVGERLDFQPDPAIPTGAQAADVASAVLSKIRLMGKRGVILIPPNCGQELFDVVQISDAGANQSAVKLRVVGLRFEYNPKQARYQHRLSLGAP